MVSIALVIGTLRNSQYYYIAIVVGICGLFTLSFSFIVHKLHLGAKAPRGDFGHVNFMCFNSHDMKRIHKFCMKNCFVVAIQEIFAKEFVSVISLLSVEFN